MLHRAPAVARSFAFQREVTQWISEQRSKPLTPASSDAHPTWQAAVSNLAPNEDPRAIGTRHEQTHEDEHGDGFSGNAPNADTGQRWKQRSDISSLISRQAKPGVRSHLFESRSPGQPRQGRSLAESQNLDLPPHRTPEAFLETLSAESTFDEFRPSDVVAEPVSRHRAVNNFPRVESSLAGAFFLVNVALSLGLYSDFTCPVGNNLELDIWDFVCLLAAQFVGSELKQDILTQLFAELAGRTPEQPPGAGYHPPQNWHVPNEWLEPFPEPFEWIEEIREGRLQVAHPAGFLVHDQALQPTPNGAADLDGWLRWVALYVRARLQRAMARRDAAEFLCRVQGMVEMTSMHLDIYYPLQTYPTEIRLAGLDRDPGWVPAAGRYVAYHFD